MNLIERLRARRSTEVIEWRGGLGFATPDPLCEEAAAEIERLTAQVEVMTADRLSFVDAVEDALTWNSSQSQCMYRIEQLIRTERATLSYRGGD